MRAYLLNLPDATERLAHCKNELANANIPVTVIEAVLGKELEFPHPDFDEKGYILRQGRRRIDAEVGCYLSHIKALHTFLKSKDEYGLILEDDVRFECPHLLRLINRAIEIGGFDILRLSTVNSGRWKSTIPLDDTYSMGVAFTREKGAGAYLVNRKAAQRMVNRYLPMQLPYDHRFDIEWLDGLTALGVTPLPIEQRGGFATQIQNNVRSYYLPAIQRYWTVFPCRAFWEIGRALMRSISFIKSKQLN